MSQPVTVLLRAKVRVYPKEDSPHRMHDGKVGRVGVIFFDCGHLVYGVVLKDGRIVELRSEEVILEAWPKRSLRKP